MAGDEPNIAGFVMLPFAGGETVYKWFETGKGPSQSTAPTSQAWRDLSKGHVDVAELINKAVSDSGAAWEGSAGDAARGATSPLATWADVTGETATSAATTSDSVGEAYVNAKYAMAKPPAVPDKPFLNDYAFWETDYDEAVKDNQKVSEANMRAFSQYGETVSASTNNMPTFISPTATDANMQEQGSGPIDKVDPPGPGTPPKIGDRTGGGDRLTSGDDDSTGTSGWKPPGTGDDTNPSRVDPKFPPPPPNDDWRNRPPPPNVDPNLPPGGGTGRWNPNDPNDPRNRGRLDPNDPRNRPGGPNAPGAGRGGGGGGGAGGGGGGGGLGAGGLGGAAAAKAGGMGGMGSGFGGAAGVAGAGEQGRGAGGFGPAGGAAGAAGRGGAAGMGAGGMGAGGQRGQGEEDKEHKSASYLQETEDIFGDGTMVAPPVIGG
jgi:hypothetical protein